MPIVLLTYKRGSRMKKSAHKLAKELPEIIAPNFSISQKVGNEGYLARKDIIVDVRKSGRHSVNEPELRIVLFMHNYPKRIENIDQRNLAVTERIKEFLVERRAYMPSFVWTITSATAFNKV